MSTSLHLQNVYYGGPISPELARERVTFITSTLHSLQMGLWPVVHEATLTGGTRIITSIHSLADEATTRNAVHAANAALTSGGWGVAFYTEA